MLSLLLLCAQAWSILAATAQTIVLPHLSSPPVNASQVLDPRLTSFSIEFSYLTMFGGNKTNPNVLTKELMQRLVERTGVGPVSNDIIYAEPFLRQCTGREAWRYFNVRL